MKFILFSGFHSVAAILQNPKRKILRILYSPAVFERANVKRYQRAELENVKTLGALRGIPIAPSYDSELVGGIGVLAGEREYPESDNSALSDFAAYLDGVEDPYNVGAILRSLYVAGCGTAVFPSSASLSSEEILCRSSAGASELLDVRVMSANDSAKLFRAHGYNIVCAYMSSRSTRLAEAVFANKTLFVVGGERRGISRTLLDAADTHIAIEYGRKSGIPLTAAAAAAIIGYTISQRRPK